jgi:collagenase-like PrtC family protease
MMLDVPFLPEKQYVDFLAANRTHLHSVHFSSFSAGAPDARHRFRELAADRLAGFLASLEDVRKYLLLNSRFHSPHTYHGQKELERIVRLLPDLYNLGQLDGVIFADAYLLAAISDAIPDTVSRLEAVPSVNFMLDSSDKVFGLLDFLKTMRFRFPSKLVLDRSLNRKPAELEIITTRLRMRWPGLKISLLANEGCLYQCPFKPAHDAHIALTYLEVPVDTYGLNRDFGCMRMVAENPALLFKSPFIRPEDLPAYKPYADIVKICGRTLGADFLMRVITAYIDKRWKGNLLDLMDSMSWFSGYFYVDNARLPESFLDRTAGCDKTCIDCGFCRELVYDFSRRLQPLSPGEASSD